MRRILFALLALGLMQSAACAEIFGLLDRVPGHPGTVWADLMRKVVPDLELKHGVATGEAVIDWPHVGGAGFLDGAPTLLDLRTIAVERMEAGGEPHLLVLASLGDHGAVELTEVLALFDAELELLDAVQVGFARSTGFDEPALIRIGPQDEAVATRSEHWNSNQSYVDTTLLFVRDGKFQVIDTIFTFSDRTCNHEQTQTLAVAASHDGGQYWPIVARVAEIRTVSNECETSEPIDPPFSQIVSVTYRWSEQAGRYLQDSDALEWLADRSRQRF